MCKDSSFLRNWNSDKNKRSKGKLMRNHYLVKSLILEKDLELKQNYIKIS